MPAPINHDLRALEATVPTDGPVVLSGSVAIIGCGNMGAALLSGCLVHGRPAESIIVVEPDAAKAAALRQRFGVFVTESADAMRPPYAALIVLAVKPQVLADIAPLYSEAAAAGSAILSIAAGCRIAALTHWLGETAAILRAMPNTPAAVHRGVTVVCAGPNVVDDQRRLCDEFLSAVGAVEWIEDETLMDAVTAVSGSGPAYVFLLAECLAVAGIEAGLPAALAERLARATVAGAGELLFRATEPAAELRRQVTSPRGTTEAALAALLATDGLQPLITEAVKRATARSGDLSR